MLQELSLEKVESIENGLQPNSGVTPLFSMRTASLASSQSSYSIAADTWCKWTLRVSRIVTENYESSGKINIREMFKSDLGK